MNGKVMTSVDKNGFTAIVNGCTFTMGLKPSSEDFARFMQLVLAEVYQTAKAEAVKEVTIRELDKIAQIEKTIAYYDSFSIEVAKVMPGIWEKSADRFPIPPIFAQVVNNIASEMLEQRDAFIKRLQQRQQKAPD